jgi:hypothetical protein
MKRTRSFNQKTAVRKVAKTDKSKKLAMYKQPNNVRLARRNADYGQIVCALTTPTYGAFTLRLSNVPNSAEFTSLYDQYKINAVSLTFYPQLTEASSIVAVTSVQNARVLTAIDYTDAAIPVSMDELREYENCEVNSAVKSFSVYIENPKFIDNTGSLRTGYISTSSPSTLHYGLKYAIETLNPASAGAYLFRVEAVYYMSFKAIK